MLSSGALLLLAALTLMPVPPGVEARNSKLPVGCDTSQIRTMILLNCGRYKRSQRSPQEVIPSKEDEGKDGASDFDMSPATLRRLDSESDDLLRKEWLAYVEIGEDVDRYIRAENSIRRCCFEGCSPKDFIDLC